MKYCIVSFINATEEYLSEVLIVVKNTYTTNDGDANKTDDVDECVCRVIIETRKREREKRIERVMRTNDDDDDDGDQEEEKHKQKKKKRVSYFSLTANQLHDTTHKKNEETAALSIHPSYLDVC
jgi:hypothetical protein